MERVYVRLAPGMSLEDSSRLINEMGETVRKQLPPGAVDLVLTNVGSPGNARSAMTSPNAGPHMGFIRFALPEAEQRRFIDAMSAVAPGRGFVHYSYCVTSPLPARRLGLTGSRKAWTPLNLPPASVWRYSVR